MPAEAGTTHAFVHDNAPIHQPNNVVEWFEDHGIELLDWPPYSPDLNPIENVWSLLKLYLNQHYPYLVRQGKSEYAIQVYKDAIQEAWYALKSEIINNCILSIRNRIKACIRAKGWYTKY